MSQQPSATVTGSLPAAVLGGKACGISRLGGSHHQPHYRLACKQSTNWRMIIPKKFLLCYESSRPHDRFAHLGIQQREWESLENLTLNFFFFLSKTFTGLWKYRVLEGTNKTLCTSGSRRKDQWPHTRLSQTCCVCLGVCSRGAGWRWPVMWSEALIAFWET